MKLTLRKITIILFLLLLIPLTYAQTTQPVIDQAGLQNFIVKEDIKTRNEIKAHIDKVKDDLTKYVENEGQAFIDANFKVLDDRVHSLANKMLIKAVIGIIASILFSQLIWFLIKRKIGGYKHRQQVLRQEMIPKTPSGQMPTPPSPPMPPSKTPLPKLPEFKLE